jgi:hypothetical protein
MKTFKFILNFIFLLFSICAYSQFSKGMLRMEVNGIKLNGEDASPDMASHLGNMDVVIYSDGIIQKSVMNMMMMKTITIVDTRKDSVNIYMDMMGKKYRIQESNKRHMDSLSKSTNSFEENIQIEEFPKDVKEILGFKCHRVDVKVKLPDDNSTTGKGQEVHMKMYVTNELKFDPSYLTQTSKQISLKGAALEYTMSMGSGSFQMEVNMLAKEYKKDINPSDLLPPDGNYKLYTMEEFQKEMTGGRK